MEIQISSVEWITVRCYESILYGKET